MHFNTRGWAIFLLFCTAPPGRVKLASRGSLFIPRINEQLSISNKQQTNISYINFQPKMHSNTRGWAIFLLFCSTPHHPAREGKSGVTWFPIPCTKRLNPRSNKQNILSIECTLIHWDGPFFYCVSNAHFQGG